jgi:hypothetical protein
MIRAKRFARTHFALAERDNFSTADEKSLAHRYRAAESVAL